MKAQMLTLIQEGHLAIEKCKRRARDILYWPNMNKDVYEIVSRCDVCQELRYSQPKQPLTMHESPDRPWAMVGCDLFFLKQTPYHLTVDYYSHYPEIALLSNESGRQMIMQLKSLFSRHGISLTLLAVRNNSQVRSSSKSPMSGASNTRCPARTINSRTVLSRIA